MFDADLLKMKVRICKKGGKGKKWGENEKHKVTMSAVYNEKGKSGDGCCCCWWRSSWTAAGET